MKFKFINTPIFVYSSFLMTSGNNLKSAATMPKINIATPMTVHRIFHPNPGALNIDKISPCARKKLIMIGTSPKTKNAIPITIGTILYPKNFNACFNDILYLTNLNHSII